MAADFAQRPTSALPSHFNPHPHQRIYNPSSPTIAAGRVSPFTSAPSTPITASSPASPHASAAHATPPSQRPHSPQQHFRRSQHTRHARSPLYIPAVLRPTDKPSGGSSIAENDSPAPSPVSGLWNDSWKRLLTGGCESSITRVVGDEWNDQALGAVTGPPTRNHWKPDASTPACQSPSHTPSSSPTGSAADPGAFTLFRRRHHCRRCGDIFCARHAPHAVPLDQHARFHPDGSAQRACDACWADFSAWANARAERVASRHGSASGGSAGRGSNAGALVATSAAVASVPVRAGSSAGSSLGKNTAKVAAAAAAPPAAAASPEDRSSGSASSSSRPISSKAHTPSQSQHIQQPGGQAAPEGYRVGTVASSVPRDWTWSTF